MMVHDRVYELGESVEVSPDDLGFKNSWFEAKIITVYKNRNKAKTPAYYDVEYKTMVEEEDEDTLLAERIKAGLIRPLSPSLRGQHDFQLNDVVEAFYRDGWWVGVVSKVLVQPGNFEVTFKDPPDQIECKREDLRLHLQWKDGAWLQPQEANQPETGGKCSTTKKGRKIKALVWQDQYDKPKPKKLRKDSVGSSIGDGKKNVHGFKEANNSKKRKYRSPVGYQQSPINSPTAVSDSIPRKKDTEGSKVTFLNMTVSAGENASVHSAPHNDNPGRFPIWITQDIICSVKEPVGLISGTLDQAVAPGITSVGNERKSVNYSRELAIVEQPEVIKDVSNYLNPNQGTEILEQTASVKGDENLIVTERLEIVDRTAVVERNHREILDPLHEREILEQVTAVEENISKHVNHNQNLNIGKEASTVEGNVSKLVIEPNQELDKNGRNLVNTNQELEIWDSFDQNLPFVKSPLWNIIESMEVFKAIPQRPHFRGLLDKNVAVHCLEGKAIGYMLMFSDIVQKTAESKLDDERELIVQRLKTLAKLEKNGFDVKGIRDRLIALLARKDEHTTRKDELATIQGQLMEHNMKKTQIFGEIEGLNEKIKEMREKLAKAMSLKENIECEVDRLETEAVDLNQSFEGSIIGFERLRAAPW